MQNEADAYRKIRLRAEDVQGRNVLTNFWVSTAPTPDKCFIRTPLPSALNVAPRQWGGRQTAAVSAQLGAGLRGGRIARRRWLGRYSKLTGIERLPLGEPAGSGSEQLDSMAAARRQPPAAGCSKPSGAAGRRPAAGSQYRQQHCEGRTLFWAAGLLDCVLAARQRDGCSPCHIKLSVSHVSSIMLLHTIIPTLSYKPYPTAQGMDFTTDKLRSLVRKWQTLIEAHVDVKTTDGYLLRLFCISFTMKRPGQIKKTCYAQSSQVRHGFLHAVHWLQSAGDSTLCICLLRLPASCTFLLCGLCSPACCLQASASCTLLMCLVCPSRSAPSARRWWRSCSARRHRAT